MRKAVNALREITPVSHVTGAGNTTAGSADGPEVVGADGDPPAEASDTFWTLSAAWRARSIGLWGGEPGALIGGDDGNEA